MTPEDRLDDPFADPLPEQVMYHGLLRQDLPHFYVLCLCLLLSPALAVVMVWTLGWGLGWN
jgi:hypothetical protein